MTWMLSKRVLDLQKNREMKTLWKLLVLTTYLMYIK